MIDQDKICDLYNFFNYTSNCTPSKHTEVWVTIIIGIITSILFPLFIRYWSGKSERKFRPMLLDSSNKVFEELSGNDNKRYWRLIPSCFEHYVMFDCQKLFSPLFEKDVYQFKENLNKIGSLYLSGVIDQGFLFNTYGDKIIEFYCMLKVDINRERRRNPEHCKLFEYMHYSAMNYLKNKDPEKYTRSCEKYFKRLDKLDATMKQLTQLTDDQITERLQEFKKEYPEEIPGHIIDEIPRDYLIMMNIKKNIMLKIKLQRSFSRLKRSTP